MTQLSPPAPADVRAVLRNYCSGVTVVTAAAPDGTPLGFTCQAFTFLSHTPPLVSFNPARTSTTWPTIRNIDQFTVNMLADGQTDVSDAFARSGVDKFASVPWTPGPAGPVLTASLGWLACEIDDEHDGGDHTIVVARVIEFDFDAALRPLLYFRGQYHGAQPSAHRHACSRR